MRSQHDERFGESLLAHLDAAYNLARWLTRDETAAEDVVQEAYCRALKYRQSFRGGPICPWFLRIVRRMAYDWLSQFQRQQKASAFDENQHGQSAEETGEQQYFKQLDAQWLRQSLERLPEPFREATVLRDLEGLSYQEIADVMEVPIGTVMSRLARGRKQLQAMLMTQSQRER